jgi:hypothetical protein
MEDLYSPLFLYCFFSVKPIMKIKKPLRAAERFGEIVAGGSDQQAQNSRRVSPASRRSSRLLDA